MLAKIVKQVGFKPTVKECEVTDGDSGESTEKGTVTKHVQEEVSQKDKLGKGWQKELDAGQSLADSYPALAVTCFNSHLL